MGKKEKGESSTRIAMKIKTTINMESIAIRKAFRNKNFRPVFLSSKKIN